MDTETSMRAKIEDSLGVTYMDIVNESHMHSGPARDSHFKLTLVSEDFIGLSAVKRHRLIYKTLEEELAGPVHALALHTYTPEEWQKLSVDVPASPNCRGGSKTE